MTNFYRVAEFAQLAGVSVRTLQYYDRINLLSPSQKTDAGHRLYQRSDLLRLQQIVTLKWMGFALDDIKTMLDSPTYDLYSTLQAQKSAIDAQITQLQQASDALSDALSSDELQAGQIASDAVLAIIHAITQPKERWLQGQFSDEAWAGIVSRQQQYTQSDFDQFAEDWRILIEKFAELQHLPPESDRVQHLAQQMDVYIRQFSADDSETEAGVAQVWQNRETMPADYQSSSPDPDLMNFMQRALAIYRQ